MERSDQNISELVAQLADVPGSDRLFNPYGSPDSPQAAIRRANLTRYLKDMLARRPNTLMLFEAPGYRGCALTGIPVTSERIMLAGIPKWGLFGNGYHPTSGQPRGVSEMTATILWAALEEHFARSPLIWNSVPLHPHKPSQPQSNRAPTSSEQVMGLAFVEQVIQLYGIERSFAVGRTAQKALAALGRKAISLRHPSQGGKPEFLRGLRLSLNDMQ